MNSINRHKEEIPSRTLFNWKVYLLLLLLLGMWSKSDFAFSNYHDRVVCRPSSTSSSASVVVVGT